MPLPISDPPGMEHYDLAGIGIGPANLSVAALLFGENTAKLRFFDREQQLSWHAGLMFHETEMQTSFLEDLVTPVDPTNKLSFMSFLAETGRIFSFLCRDTTTISRMEFQQYLGWAASKLPCLQFAEEWKISVSATAVSRCEPRGAPVLRDPSPLAWVNCRSYHAGHAITYPRNAAMWRKFSDGNRGSKGRALSWWAGGQSAADLMNALLTGEIGRPTVIHWVAAVSICKVWTTRLL